MRGVPNQRGVGMKAERGQGPITMSRSRWPTLLGMVTGAAHALNSVISVSFFLNITASPEDLGLNAFKFR